MQEKEELDEHMERLGLTEFKRFIAALGLLAFEKDEALQELYDTKKEKADAITRYFFS